MRPPFTSASPRGGQHPPPIPSYPRKRGLGGIYADDARPVESRSRLVPARRGAQGFRASVGPEARRRAEGLTCDCGAGRRPGRGSRARVGVCRARGIPRLLGAAAQAGGRRDLRQSAGVNGIDHLRAVDSLQIDRGDAEVGMAQLVLDDERDLLVGQLDRVGMTHLMWGKRCLTPAVAAVRASWRGADAWSQWRPAVGPWITHSNRPTGNRTRSCCQGSSCSHAQLSIPTSRRLAPLRGG